MEGKMVSEEIRRLISEGRKNGIPVSEPEKTLRAPKRTIYN
jgi:hypothetical protein